MEATRERFDTAAQVARPLQRHALLPPFQSDTNCSSEGLTYTSGNLLLTFTRKTKLVIASAVQHTHTKTLHCR